MELSELMLINKLDGVILKYPHHENIDGTVVITSHHLLLSSRKEGVRELWDEEASIEVREVCQDCRKWKNVVSVYPPLQGRGMTMHLYD